MVPQTLEFLQEIFGEDEIEDGFYAIMTLPPGGNTKPKHVWFNNNEAAAAYASSVDGHNVYFSMGLFPGNKAGRTMESVMGIACFGIDVDIKSHAHRRDNLCPDIPSALQLLNTAIPGCIPTMIISSGHGLQGFFAFKEPIQFEDMDDKKAAYATASALHRTIAYRAGKFGWHIDSTFDLSRVMRLPGTYNVKIPDDPKMVAIVEKSGQKYAGLDDFQGLIAENTDWERARVAFKPFMPNYSAKLGLVLQQDAMAPAAKLENLLEAELWFKHLWFRKNLPCRPKDGVKEEDRSLSSADMSMANFAAQYGWTDQEIANLIIEYRRRWQQKPGDMSKALREDYIERTIGKARERFLLMGDNKKEQSKEWATTARKVADAQSKGKDITKEVDLVNEGRKAISEYMGFPVDKIIKYRGTPADYVLVPTKGDPVRIGKSSVLMNQQLLAQVMLDQANKVLTKKKATDFHNILTAMATIIIEEDSSTDTDDDALMGQRVMDYWQGATISDDKNEGFKRKAPFRHEGRAFIFGSQFRKWIYTEENERLQAKTMGMQLMQINCRAQKMNFELFDNRGKTVTNTSVYDVTSVVGTQPTKASDDE